MSGINVALATRNNILVYMRKVMRPVTQAEIIDNCDMPKCVPLAQLPSVVDRGFRSLATAGEVIRMPAPDAKYFGTRYVYRLAGPMDPTPKTIRVYAPHGSGKKPKSKTARMQLEANAIAEQLRTYPAPIKANPILQALAKKAMDEKYESSPDKSVEQEPQQAEPGPTWHPKGHYDSHPVGYLIPEGVQVDVTSTGLTITLGKITVTIKADA
jgi:hypothetical protein